jgi:hypothetical protein
MAETVAETSRQTTLGRRDFLVTRLTTGFALATLPVSAATITTGAEGLEAGEISILVGDGWKRLQEWFKKNGAA